MGRPYSGVPEKCEIRSAVRESIDYPFMFALGSKSVQST